jgi:hypothetical protein
MLARFVQRSPKPLDLLLRLVEAVLLHEDGLREDV